MENLVTTGKIEGKLNRVRQTKKSLDILASWLHKTI